MAVFLLLRYYYPRTLHKRAAVIPIDLLASLVEREMAGQGWHSERHDGDGLCDKDAPPHPSPQPSSETTMNREELHRAQRFRNRFGPRDPLCLSSPDLSRVKHQSRSRHDRNRRRREARQRSQDRKTQGRKWAVVVSTNGPADPSFIRLSRSSYRYQYRAWEEAVKRKAIVARCGPPCVLAVARVGIKGGEDFKVVERV